MKRTEEDLALLSATFERNGYPRSIKAFAWQYFRNPTGRLNVQFALPEGGARAAAIYSVMPVALRMGGRVVTACQSLDTLTDSDFRGKGLFVEMAKVVFERARAEGDACVFGFPNGNSAHGFFNRLGWTSLDPVPFLIRPLRTGYALRKLPRLGSLLGRLDFPIGPVRTPRLPGQREFRRVMEFDEEFDALWERFSAGIPVAVHRNRRYLNWRLVEKPEEQYSRLALYENGRLRGFVSWAVKAKHGGQVGYVLELMHDPGAHDVADALLAQAVWEMARAGAEVLLAWAFDHSPNAPAFRANRFWPLPERLRPIELHLGVRTLVQGPSDPPLGNRWNWYISYLDSDTV